jgi:ankyrin repeat protein
MGLPLDAAAYGDEVLIDFLLLAKSAKRELRDSSGHTAEDHAANAGYIPLARKLKPAVTLDRTTCAEVAKLSRTMEHHTRSPGTTARLTTWNRP